MTNKEFIEKLTAPFKPEEILWRVGKKSKDKTKGLAFAYIDGRAVQKRLDAVAGPDKWSVSYTPIDMGTITVSTYNGEVQKTLKGFFATIKIELPEGGCITKQDGANITDFESVKGGISDSFKRVAAACGIGRYLYDLPQTWVPIDQWGNITQVPKLPSWAMPKGSNQAEPPVQEAVSTPSEYPSEYDDPFAGEYPEPMESTMSEPVGSAEITFPSGKYKGQPVSKVHDFGYLRWVVSSSQFRQDIKNAAQGVLDTVSA